MQPRLDRVELQFRDQAFQSQDQPAVGRGRVVDRLWIPDEATAVTAQIKEVIPIGAVPRPARDVVGEDEADLPEIDACDELPESGATRGAGPGDSQVRIDDLDAGSIPPAAASPRGESILESKTLLMIEHLWRVGLGGEDDGLTSERVGLNELGRRHEGLLGEDQDFPADGPADL